MGFRMQRDVLDKLKLAQRDLISRCGGLKETAKRAGVSAGHVGRWNNAELADLMPVETVYVLESACGVPYVTRAMAAIQGRRLSDVDDDVAGETIASELHSSIAAIFAHQATLMANWSAAIRDGKVTPSESTIIMRDLSKIGHEILDAQLVFAGARSTTVEV